MRWISPYYDEGTWIRGNFHTHTDVSDGDHTLAEVADHYFRFCHTKASPWMDYRFLAITDHTTSGKRKCTGPSRAPTRTAAAS